MAAGSDSGEHRLAPDDEHRQDPRDSRRFVVLARPECLKRLRETELGRVVLISDAQMPIIRPVNYGFDVASQSVVFRTGAGSKLDALARSSRALFEIDAMDLETHTAWSVIISGATEVVTRQAEIRRLRELGIEPWAPGERPHWVRIRARTVTGRAIVPVDQAPAGAEESGASEP